MNFEIAAHTTDDAGLVPYAYTLSGTISVGWQPDHKNKNSEWLRKGDYLNDTSHPIELKSDVFEYNLNLGLIHYNH